MIENFMNISLRSFHVTKVIYLAIHLSGLCVFVCVCVCVMCV